MSKLEYIEKVWDNLEESYVSYSKDKKISKKEYLSLLIGYKPDAAGSTILENYLSDEVSLYNQEEFERYENLRNLFNKIFDNLKAIGNKPVMDFDIILNRNISSFSKNDFSIMLNKSYVTPEEAIRDGFLFDSVTVQDGKVKSYAITNSAAYRAVYSNADLTDFIYSVKNDSSEFEKSAYAASIYLAKCNKLVTPMVFIGNKYFKIEGKYFVAGGIKHTCDIIRNGVKNAKLLSGEQCEIAEEFAIFRMRINGRICAIVGVL